MRSILGRTSGPRQPRQESGIVWATEPHVDFFVSFIDLAMHQQQLPQVKTAVQDYASRRGVSVQVATDYLAAEFMAEAIWLAKAGALRAA